MLRENRYVTIEETASLLSVSSATIRNWMKHDYLKPAENGVGTMFRYGDVDDLKHKIHNGYIKRLDRRANKAKAKRSFMPDEYLQNDAYRKKIEWIVSYIAEENMNHSRALFVLALRRLLDEECITINDIDALRNGRVSPCNNVHVGRDIAAWHHDCGRFILSAKYMRLLEVDLPTGADILGLIYQSLLCEGDKSRNGSYYTPGGVVEDISTCYAESDHDVLDPCCGTGQFLMAFAKRQKNPLKLCGTDIDDLAVRIARLNLMCAFKDRDFEPRIYRCNFLTDHAYLSNLGFCKFDLIATNPPWGLHFTSEEHDSMEHLFPSITSFESFSFILARAFDLLNDDGRISFILPESILQVKTHGDIRKYILEHATIDRIIHLGKIFKNVFTSVIRLDLRKKVGGGKLAYISKDESYKIDQKRFLRNNYFQFDVCISPADDRILDKVYGHDYSTLAGKADWVLGIVTGDNAKYICNYKRDGGYEEIFKGRDVEKYILRASSSYIKFTPQKFQQSAPEHKYRASEKLVYRFISKNLVFAYDNRGRLTLNSANIVIPKLEGYPIKAIMALFNSSLYQFLFQKKYASIKVLRSHLEGLPIPLWNSSILASLASMVDAVLDGWESIASVDQYIMDLFALSFSERRLILRSIK